MLEHALAAYAAGLSVLPPREDGSKQPWGRWTPYQQTRADEDQVRRWYANGRAGLGTVTGQISGNLECLEFDDARTYTDFKALAGASGLGDLVARIEAGYLEQSPSGGIHWLYRCPEIAGNTKLANRPEGLDERGQTKVKTLIETRGEGGFVVLAPSHGSVHPTGKPYVRLAGSFATIAAINPGERQALFELARVFDAQPVVKAAKTATRQRHRTTGDGERPGDRFNAETDWIGLLEPRGWVRVYEREGVSYWRRPGKDHGISATTGFGGDWLYVFSSSTEFETGRCYDRFGAFAVLEHGGAWKAAAKAAAMLLDMELIPGMNPTHFEATIASEPPAVTTAESIAKPDADTSTEAEAIIHAALARFKEGDRGAPLEPAVLDAWRALKTGNFARYVALKAGCKGILKYLDEALGEPSAPDPKRPTRTSASLRAQYAVIDGSLHLLKESPFGPVPVLLGDFDARITRTVTYDDGASERSLFVIEGRRASGQPLSTVQVPTAQFATLNWVNTYWGHGVTVAAGQSLKDHARAGIQILSRERGDIPRQIIFGHLGWRRLEDGWYFLHGGGAIGEAGQRTGVEVDIGPGHLQHYRLPDPPAPKSGEIIAAIRASLALATLAANPAIGWSLLAAIYRAPLSEALPVDMSIFLHGPTGAKKSELTALALAHFGAFDSRNFPANWQDSPNRLEKISHHVKDALLVVDDFKPQGDSRANAKLHDAAERLLHHAAGNRSGRGRMRADLSEAPSYYPRGLILCSGEDLPGTNSPSLRARLWVLRLEPVAVNLSALSAMQRQRSALAHAMSGYLAWLAPQLDDLKRDTGREFEELRDRLAAGTTPAHPRTPANHAHLRIGIESFLAYAQDAGALNPDERERCLAEAVAALAAAASQHAAYLQDADEVGRFLSLLQAVLTGDMGHLCEKESNGLPAEHASLMGWRSITRYNPEARANEETREPRGPCIGWVDRQHVYLEPELTYGQVCALAQRQGRPFAVSAQSLWARLKDRGLLARWNAAGQRHTHRETINGQRRAVIVLYLHHLVAPEGMPS